MTDLFRLDDSFIQQFIGQQPKWGPVGYVTYKRTYARDLDKIYPRHAELAAGAGLADNEEFWLTLVRVTEGMFTILRDHCRALRLPWDEVRAQKMAQDVYRSMWEFKWSPPGRGLWMMGTPAIAKIGSTALNNCAFISSKDIDVDFSRPFCMLMDFSMLGVGVGGDTRGAGKVVIQTPEVRANTFYDVGDSREGWIDVLRVVLDAYVGKTWLPSEFDYSQVRPAGSPIMGFGGTASGPEPLIEMVASVRKVLDARVGHAITSADIVDIFNLVGRCVVSGNVRRCLPRGTLVHTQDGLTPIEKVEVGTNVLTTSGFYPVTAHLVQGKQQLVAVDTQLGVFRCTPNHQVAVMTAPGEYVFKKTEELVGDDRLVFVEESIPGTRTKLPSWSYEKPVHSTTCADIRVPDLTPDIGWFIGMLLGDGYVYANRDVNGFNAYVSVPVNNDEYHTQISARLLIAYRAFGFEASIRQPSEKDNCYRYIVTSKQLAWYLDEHFKQPKISLNVPECVLHGSIEVRAAFVAGLLDADGSVKTRPTAMACSVYPNFLKQVQSVFASLGIPTRLRLQRPAKDKWQALYCLNLVGEGARRRYRQLVQRFAVKQIEVDDKRSGHDYGYPSAWIKGTSLNYQGRWDPGTAQITTSTFERCGGVSSKLIPITVTSVQISDEEDTFDITVDGAHEFVADGLLVHNSAELLLGDRNDTDFLELKDFDKYPEQNDSHRWASNNSILAEVGQSYGRVAKRMAKNGEPGCLWLKNAQDYGRMIDLPDFKDARALGTNPCQPAWATVLTPRGISTIGDVEIGDQIWSGSEWTTITNKWSTGVKKVKAFRTTEGTFYGTENHRVICEGFKVEAKDAWGIDPSRHPDDMYLKPQTSRVIAVDDISIEEVFDLTVDCDTHTYWTGGLLVSNCSEQTLEDLELCCLVETYPTHHDSITEFKRTLKWAYLYAKVVTLMPTHDARTNAVTMRNRRIGCSMSGIVQAMNKFGRSKFLKMCDTGYQHIRELDKEYSGWLCVPESIKKTSVKPSGSISLLPQATPGIHHPIAEYYWRVIRFATNSKMLPNLRAAGYLCYEIDPAKEPNTVAVYFPVKEENFERGERDVSMWEQLEIAAALQAYWADNQVSVTIKFDKEKEGPQIARALEMYETRLKGVSFLPHDDHGYEHAPYQPIDKETYEAAMASLLPLDLSRVAGHEVTDAFCDGDKCTFPGVK